MENRALTLNSKRFAGTLLDVSFLSSKERERERERERKRGRERRREAPDEFVGEFSFETLVHEARPGSLIVYDPRLSYERNIVRAPIRISI